MGRSRAETDADRLADRLPVTLGDIRRLESIITEAFTHTVRQCTAAIDAGLLFIRQDIMATKEQSAAARVAAEAALAEAQGMRTDLDSFQVTLDKEQEQVAAALAALNEPDPDVDAAIAALRNTTSVLQAARVALAAATTDVGSTIADDPAAGDGTEGAGDAVEEGTDTTDTQP